ncbi:MAG: signal peptidase complex subunit 2 [archaeon]|nr:signal peptidase complex subunit 2 [archaeon]
MSVAESSSEPSSSNDNGAITQVEIKRVNSVFDADAVKLLLDETISGYLSGKIESGSDVDESFQNWQIDHTWTNWKLFLSVLCVLLAAVSHFWPQPFPENFYVLVACFFLYLLCSAVIQWILVTKEQHVVLTTIPRRSDRIGLVVKSRVEPFSPEYRLEIIALKYSGRDPPVVLSSTERSGSITTWFSESGKFAQSLFILHIDKMLSELELKKN